MHPVERLAGLSPAGAGANGAGSRRRSTRCCSVNAAPRLVGGVRRRDVSLPGCRWRDCSALRTGWRRASACATIGLAGQRRRSRSLCLTNGIARSRGWCTTPAVTTSIRSAAPTMPSRRCSAPQRALARRRTCAQAGEARLRKALTGRWLHPRAPRRQDAGQPRARSPHVN